LRSALNAATGDYLLILGNDDALADAQAIERLVFCLRDFNYPEVCYTSFRGYSDGIVTNRASKTGIVGAGPAAAVRTFRSFSCVCGVVMKAIEFRKWDTAEYDGSIFVQVYLAARIIASGGRGLVYWAPDWVSTKCGTRWGNGSDWENATLFDFDGNTLPAIDYTRAAFKQPVTGTFHFRGATPPECFAAAWRS